MKGLVEAFVDIAGEVGGMPFFAEGFHDDFAEVFLFFDNENFHDLPVSMHTKMKLR